MKKLVIAVAATFAAVALNAASINWSTDYAYARGSSAYADGYIGYFFDDNSANGGVARSVMLAALEDGSYTSLLSKGSFATADEEGAFYGSSLKTDYANPETMNGYFVMFNVTDEAEIANATYAYVSTLEEGKTGAGKGVNGSIGWGDVTASKDAKNWTTIGGDVPEPTSGLLLLLGMAGLALRRRRA